MKFVLLLLTLCAHSFADAWVHPNMQEAIKRNAKRPADLRDDSDKITINGKTYRTGFRPSPNFYKGTYFRSFAPKDLRGEVELPEEYDLRTMSGAPMNAQGYNDCWAQATASAWGRTVSWFFDIPSIDAAVSDVIDCSGSGSAESGGSLALNYVLKNGLAFTKDYPYIARTRRCKKDVERHYKPLAVGWVRGEGGKAFKWTDIKTAIKLKGVLPICGGAAALGGGGWVQRITYGRTNHCYQALGWFRGEKHGKKAGDYLIVGNSWGEDWGDGGFGYYLMDENMTGDVVNEAGFYDFGEKPPPIPPEPKVLSNVRIGKVLFRSITIAPAWVSKEQDVVKLITEAVQDVEAQ